MTSMNFQTLLYDHVIPSRNMVLGSNLPYLFVRCHSFQSFFLTLPLDFQLEEDLKEKSRFFTVPCADCHCHSCIYLEKKEIYGIISISA